MVEIGIFDYVVMYEALQWELLLYVLKLWEILAEFWVAIKIFLVWI